MGGDVCVWVLRVSDLGVSEIHEGLRGTVKRGDKVVLTESAVKEEIPGCLSVPPFTGKVLKVWETRDGGKYVDVRNDHDIKELPHDTTYHRDYLTLDI